MAGVSRFHTSGLPWTHTPGGLHEPFQRKQRSINLALQGGGAHGAFTWGVLDALLEDGRLRFDGVSGTSAGAMTCW
jgi:predicted acylesterase/phospholipase RssA